MSNLLITFIFALGAGAWITNQAYKRTGGNTKQALSVGAITGVLAGLIIMSILWALQ
jgi:hypothetical protein